MNDRYPESIIDMHAKDVPLSVENILTIGHLAESEVKSTFARNPVPLRKNYWCNSSGNGNDDGSETFPVCFACFNGAKSQFHQNDPEPWIPRSPNSRGCDERRDTRVTRGWKHNQWIHKTLMPWIERWTMWIALIARHNNSRVTLLLAPSIIRR